jgi:hypothetical protein
MERPNYSRSEATKLDKLAIKFPRHLTPTNPSPALRHVLGGRDRWYLSPRVGERQGSHFPAAGIHTLREMLGG